MAKRAFIRQGDRTTHGGTVITGDGTFIIGGKEVARVGDQVICPRCKGTFPIVTGAPTMFSGQNIALQDDYTGCGAKLIASQITMTWSDEAGGSMSMSSRSSSSEHTSTGFSSEEKPHAIHFQAVHP